MISTLIIDAKKSQKLRILAWVSYICYQVQFQKNKVKDILALLNSGSKLNAMTLAYTA